MKRLIMIALTAIAVMGGLAPAYAVENVEPWSNSLNRIAYTYDNRGVLTGQTMSSSSSGLVMTDGQSYTYTMVTAVTYKIVNGRAYEEKSTVTYTQESADGQEKTTVTTETTYSYDARNRLIGATGTRTTNGVTEKMTITQSGALPTGTPAIQYQYSANVENLTFAIINGEAVEIGATGTQTVYSDANKTAIIRQTVSTSVKQYEIIKGITRLVDTTTESTTTIHNNGKVNNQLPVQRSAQKQHYAYDADGNYAPTRSNVRQVTKTIGSGTNARDTQVLVGPASDTAELIDVQGATLLEKVEKLEFYLAGSYTISFTSSQENDNGWANFDTLTVTPFTVNNGMLNAAGDPPTQRKRRETLSGNTTPITQAQVPAPQLPAQPAPQLPAQPAPTQVPAPAQVLAPTATPAPESTNTDTNTNTNNSGGGSGTVIPPSPIVIPPSPIVIPPALAAATAPGATVDRPTAVAGTLAFFDGQLSKPEAVQVVTNFFASGGAPGGATNPAPSSTTPASRLTAEQWQERYGNPQVRTPAQVAAKQTAVDKTLGFFNGTVPKSEAVDSVLNFFAGR